MKRYKIIEHTADVGIKVYAEDIKQLFEMAALGMFDVITDIKKINSIIKKEVKIQSDSTNDLLVDWLNELVFKFDVNKILFGKVDIEKISSTYLSAKIYGEKYDPDKHNIKTGIKAVTYHSLDIKKQNKVWNVQIIFDV